MDAQLARVEMQVEPRGLAHAFAGKVDDKAMAAVAVKAYLHGFAAQVHGALVFVVVDGKNVCFGDFAVLFDKKDLLGELIVGEIVNAVAIEIKTIQGHHLNTAVVLGIVLLLHPVMGLVVEVIQ